MSDELGSEIVGVVRVPEIIDVGRNCVFVNFHTTDGARNPRIHFGDIRAIHGKHDGRLVEGRLAERGEESFSFTANLAVFRKLVRKVLDWRMENPLRQRSLTFAFRMDNEADAPAKPEPASVPEKEAA